MRSFDFGYIEEAGAAPGKHSAREGQLGNGVVAAFVENTGAVRDTLATFEDLADFRMRLELLELFVRIEIRVLVVEADHHPKQNFVRAHMVHEGACVDIAGQRPVDRVLDKAFSEVRIAFGDLPDFLESKPVVLDTHGGLCELEVVLEPLSEASTSSFGEYSLRSSNFDSWAKRILASSILGDAEVPCAHSSD